MGQIWIKELTGGLDVRRLPETTPGGVLVRGADGHITRGGEFEKRAAFVKAYDLPAGTVGMARTRTSLVVFGSAASAVLPTGVDYQRLQHPTDEALTEVLSYDLYDNKLYVAARFADGSVHHFYDGARVEDWYDGRARTSFRITGGTGATSLDMIYVAGAPVIAAPITWATSNEATATAVAAAIEAHPSTPEYSAYAVGDTVYIIAAAAGTAPNGRSVELAVTGAFTTEPTPIPPLADGGTDGGNPAEGTFRITSGTGAILPSVDGVAITASAVSWAGSASATASAVAAAINAHTSTPNYTASASSDKVTVRTATNTDTVNGEDITFALTGGMSVSQGGAYGVASFRVAQGLGVTGATIIVKIDGVPLFTTPAVFGANATVSAEAVAAAINAHTSSPDYTATTNGNIVIISTAAKTAAHNGKTLSFTKVGSFPTTEITAVTGGAAPSTTMTPMANGKADDAFTPGAFVKTVGSKIYSTAGSILHFSGIKAPTQWTTDAIGAGFINLASENSGSEQLTAVERYQSLLAVFAPEVVQVWYIDPDPELNRQSQVLNNTGTSAPRSVTQFGDDDIFYLDASGLRSLRARDSSNAASTTDIGVPIDALLTAKMETLTEAQRNAAIGLINPIDKRFWLILHDEVFVFSFYGNAKVSAWTTYNLSALVGGDDTPFVAEQALTFRDRVYIRSGNAIYVYGGISGPLVYDNATADAWLPFLDANVPTTKKQWTGVDVAATGVWQISAAMEPTAPDYAEVIANVSETTYNMARITMHHASTHLGLRCRSIGDGPAVLSAAVIHYEGDADED